MFADILGMREHPVRRKVSMAAKRAALRVAFGQVTEEEKPQNHFRTVFAMQEGEQPRVMRNLVRERGPEHIERNEAFLLAELLWTLWGDAVGHALILPSATN